jgi:uncharacterized protein (TIGR02996 family)
MSKEEDKKQFEEAIKANRYDEPLHRVFADFLEENGHDDESHFHRIWNKEWQEAYDWMDKFARDVVSESYINDSGRYIDIPVTVDELMEALETYQKDSIRFCLRGDGFEPIDAIFSDVSILDKIWKCYEVLGGVMGENIRFKDPFACCI